MKPLQVCVLSSHMYNRLSYKESYPVLCSVSVPTLASARCGHYYTKERFRSSIGIGKFIKAKTEKLAQILMFYQYTTHMEQPANSHRIVWVPSCTLETFTKVIREFALILIQTHVLNIVYLNQADCLSTQLCGCTHTYIHTHWQLFAKGTGLSLYDVCAMMVIYGKGQAPMRTAKV